MRHPINYIALAFALDIAAISFYKGIANDEINSAAWLTMIMTLMAGTLAISWTMLLNSRRLAKQPK
jgi:hypothetical protein